MGVAFKSKPKNLKKCLSFTEQALQPLIIIQKFWGYSRFTPSSRPLTIWKYFVFVCANLASNVLEFFFTFESNGNYFSNVFYFCASIFNVLTMSMHFSMACEFTLRSGQMLNFHKRYLNNLIKKIEQLLNVRLNPRKPKMICISLIFCLLIPNLLIDFSQMVIGLGRIQVITLCYLAYEFLISLAYVEYAMIINIFVYLSDQLLNYVKELRRRHDNNDVMRACLYKISFVHELLMENCYCLNRVYVSINIIIHVKLFIRSVLMTYLTAILFRDVGKGKLPMSVLASSKI